MVEAQYFANGTGITLASTGWISNTGSLVVFALIVICLLKFSIWKKADKSPALNPDLWEILLNEIKKHKITYVWVKGHAGHPYNERCDAMAQTESGKFINQ